MSLVRQQGKVMNTPSPVGHRRVLVVDDHHDTADSTAIVLQMLGHKVCVAYNGRRAVEIARNFQPDVVLLDLALPEMTGIEVAKRLRAEDACKGALLVAVTGYGREEDRRQTTEAGFNAHLLKPADLGTLKELLANGGCN
jgi:CheY-like chemotaxis protein